MRRAGHSSTLRRAILVRGAPSPCSAWRTGALQATFLAMELVTQPALGYQCNRSAP
ncbi:conserved protein of unknown function [Ectopseudomonas oleovorans]|uniref:Uncharacterized protein n=1 Tax=Ectopseudomonas oleovorans TaxID=301 RepID=A0A653B159_ECTOL|nr:conserved protein of unknown function [Pseudomonas oleovorans]